MLFPVVGVVVADENLAAAGAVDLDVTVRGVFLERGVVAERDRAAGAEEHGIAAVVRGRVEAERVAREPRGDHRLDEPEGRERILAAGLEPHGNFHRECGEPERVDPGGIAREEHAQAVRLREKIHVEAGLRDDAGVKEPEREAAREAGEDGADVGHRGVDLRHVAAAEAVGEAGELGKRGGVVGGRLQAIAVAPRETAVEVEFGGLLHAGDKGRGRDGAERGGGPGEIAEVAAD